MLILLPIIVLRIARRLPLVARNAHIARQTLYPVKGDLGNGKEGVLGLQVPGRRGDTVVSLYDGARQALYQAAPPAGIKTTTSSSAAVSGDTKKPPSKLGKLLGQGFRVLCLDLPLFILLAGYLATDPAYRGILLAAASTSLEPKYSDACLRALEILPGLTVHDMLSYRQIGRDGVLTSDKRTHFRLLHQESGVPYTEMLFFDDCNWGDHVGTLWRAHGVVGQRTPAGLTFVEFEQGLARYRKQAQELEHAVISNPSKKQKSPRKKT